MSEDIKPFSHPSPDPFDELVTGATYPGERPEDRGVPPDPEELDRRKKLAELLDEDIDKHRPDKDAGDRVQEASEESFPASDPPSWTAERR